MTKISGSSAEQSDKHQNVWNDDGSCVPEQAELSETSSCMLQNSKLFSSRFRLKFGTNEITPVQNFWPLD